MIRLILGIILSSMTIGLHAQQRITRSPAPQQLYLHLQKNLNSASSPDTIVELYTTYALQNIRLNPDSAESAIKRISQIDNVPLTKRQAHISLIKANLYSRPNPDSALFFLENSLNLFDELNEHRKIPGLLSLKSRILGQINEYLKAEDTLIKAIEIVQNNQNDFEDIELNNLLNSLAGIYMRVGATDIAIARYRQMLEIETSKDKECRVRMGISNAYKANQEYEEAKSFLEPCLNEPDIPVFVLVAVNKSYADLEKMLDNPDERLFYLKKAMDLQQQTRRKDITAYLFLAEAYYDIEEYATSDSVLALISDRELQREQPFTQIHIHILQAKLHKQNRDFNTALEVLEKTLAILKRVPPSPLETDVNMIRAEIYNELGNSEKAYEITKNTQATTELIRERAEVREEANSRVRFQMRAKNQELADVTSELGTVKTRNALIIILLILLSSYILYRYRVHFLLKEERTRTKLARDLHDDLSATLSSISFFSEAAKREKSKGPNRFLKRIDESAIEAKERINDIIWAIDPDNDDWESFLTKCKRFSAEMFESKNIAYKIDIDTKAEVYIDIKARKDLWLVFKEIITNLVRHSDSSNAKVTFRSHKDRFSLLVEDDGIGFDTGKKYKGNGLFNIKKRISSISENANLILESEPDKGTRWELTLMAK